MVIYSLLSLILKGGLGSGNWGHMGRLATHERGGSVSTGNVAGAGMSLSSGPDSAKRRAKAQALAAKLRKQKKTTVGAFQGVYSHNNLKGKKSSDKGKAKKEETKNTMRTINSLNQIIELSKKAEANGETMFIRWSRGPAMDKKQGASMDYTNHTKHNGLSAQPVRHDNPELLAQMLPEYKFLRRKDEKIYCWIFIGKQNGVDSDNAPTVDAESIKPVGRVSDELIKKCDDYSWAYRTHRQKYSYNTDGKQERIERNAKLDADVKAAWEAVVS